VTKALSEARLLAPRTLGPRQSPFATLVTKQDMRGEARSHRDSAQPRSEAAKSAGASEEATVRREVAEAQN